MYASPWTRSRAARRSSSSALFCASVSASSLRPPPAWLVLRDLRLTNPGIVNLSTGDDGYIARAAVTQHGPEHRIVHRTRPAGRVVGMGTGGGGARCCQSVSWNQESSSVGRVESRRSTRAQKKTYPLPPKSRSSARRADPWHPARERKLLARVTTRSRTGKERQPA
jgi:hypothetical protein